MAGIPGTSSSRLFVRVLGETRAEFDGQPVALGHARQRAVLAVLSVDANRVVPVECLLDRVWGDRAPNQARSALRTYLSHLRRALAPAGVTITREWPGYRLSVDPAAVDLHRFGQDRARARQEREPGPALSKLERALALWRGRPLAELDTPWAELQRERLYYERAAAETDRIDLALRCGDHDAVLPELFTRTAADPLNERTAGQLMVALYRSGRPADALNHYLVTRNRLIAELGTEPSPELRRLHEHLLAAHPTLTSCFTAICPSCGGWVPLLATDR